MNLTRAKRGTVSFATLTRAILAARRPRPRPLAERLRQIPLDGAPLEQAVTIRWNDRHVPFIEAATDRDCAVALGIVHAHLRLGQLEITRRLSQGRVAEMIGPAGIELDHALRAFHFTRDIPASIAAMSPETRLWLEGFADGINHVLMNAAELPREFEWLALAREPWSITDIVGIGRLSGADVHWMIWLKLLRLRHHEAWPALWEKVLEQGVAGLPQSPLSDRAEDALETILSSSRSGSNSFAADGRLTGTGSAILASDPHLPIVVPNIWLLAGFTCPSYRVVGYMLPALPFVALGRNGDIAWGGTNLHAASTDLIELPDDCPFTTRTETIRVRGGPDEIRHIRDSPYGPVVSDAPMLGKGLDCFALKWAGHHPTRDFDAMLGFNRASNWDQFAKAADDFAVPGQNFVYADRHGHVGKLIAARLPRRKTLPSASLLASLSQAEDWAEPAVSSDLPREYEPACGFVASANDEPPAAAFPIGFFYSTRDRVRRISQLLAHAEPVTVATMKRLQRDVSAQPVLRFRDLILELYDRAVQDREIRRYSRPVIAALRQWDGVYDADSGGALAFETVKSLLADALHSPAEKAAYGSVWHTRDLIEASLRASAPDRSTRIVGKVVEHAVTTVKRYRVWGNVHRLRLRHPLAMLPIVGRRFQFGEWGAGGSGDTVMKTGTTGGTGPHGVPYGSIARHISDLSDEDENYFCLLGGQDGWFGSDTMLDEVEHWQHGRYMRVGMRPATIERDFPHMTVVTPP